MLANELPVVVMLPTSSTVPPFDIFNIWSRFMFDATFPGLSTYVLFKCIFARETIETIWFFNWELLGASISIVPKLMISLQLLICWSLAFALIMFAAAFFLTEPPAFLGLGDFIRIYFPIIISDGWLFCWSIFFSSIALTGKIVVLRMCGEGDGRTRVPLPLMCISFSCYCFMSSFMPYNIWLCYCLSFFDWLYWCYSCNLSDWPVADATSRFGVRKDPVVSFVLLFFRADIKFLFII